MPVDFCNAPSTFQRCIIAIFESLVGNIMDDFSMLGSSFDACMFNLERVLKKCEETHRVSNWEKMPLYGQRRDSSWA